ncbi:hypothetical protein [Reinekea blandensis]|uniref:Apea-like HEPN domain-containing protein n=1 Tax=Reinekea blandensis MED297 TaxID=314283 RepID=A4BFJ2_9GAMM|nr:hypothetical protein [Reinekea blandensis]EAR09087.1 hypothetical protein MED297_17133 [Reinekea sp. MED297] [Reinekea blandensis MED297]
MKDLTSSTAQHLKQQLKSADPALPDDLATRLHRAISWLQAAEDAVNDDMEFIALWIAFSACCSIDQQGDAPLEDHEQFLRFVGNLVKHDHGNRIYSCLWEEYSTHVKALIRNPYVFHPFWVSQREGNDAWQRQFDQSSLAALNALSRGRVTELCSIVLDRLFVLRNQLIFGGATYQGRVNREQVTDGAGLLGTLLPIMISIMLQAGDEDWGNIAYPVVGPLSSTR